jgi:hypothetical protein
MNGTRINLPSKTGKNIKRTNTPENMKTIQLNSHTDDNDALLYAAGVKRIHAGWYTVTYRGVKLDCSAVTSAARNPKGQIRFSK